MVFLLALSLHAASVDPVLAAKIENFSNELSRFKRGTLAEWRAKVFNDLAKVGCALYLEERSGDLFEEGGVDQVNTPGALFIRDLISEDPRWRMRAMRDLPGLSDEFVKPIKYPLFMALEALIDVELRSPAVEAFLTRRKDWPADFVDWLRAFAVERGEPERLYVVRLLRATSVLEGTSTRAAWMRGKFYLEKDRIDAGLERILTSRGRMLCGEP